MSWVSDVQDSDYGSGALLVLETATCQMAKHPSRYETCFRVCSFHSKLTERPANLPLILEELRDLLVSILS